MKQEFSTFDIIKGLVIQRGRLREWMNFKFITPSVQADGQGTRAVFTLFDVHCVALFRSLIEYGFSREVAGSFLRDFQKRTKEREKVGIHTDVDYIVFRETIEAGKKNSVVLQLDAGDWKFDIKEGNIDWKLTGDWVTTNGVEIIFNSIQAGVNDWRAIHMINFKTLRKEVDAALEKL